MSHFRCPLCGLAKSIRTYDPSDYLDVIMILTQHSKGRGRGFYPPSEAPISDFDDKDELKKRILNRISDLYFCHCEEEDEAEEKDEEEEEDDKEDEYKAQNIEDGEMYDPAADSRREEDNRNMSDLDRELARADRELARKDTPL